VFFLPCWSLYSRSLEARFNKRYNSYCLVCAAGSPLTSLMRCRLLRCLFLVHMRQEPRRLYRLATCPALRLIFNLLGPFHDDERGDSLALKERICRLLCRCRLPFLILKTCGHE
jgi:hypothetical protein